MERRKTGLVALQPKKSVSNGGELVETFNRSNCTTFKLMQERIESNQEKLMGKTAEADLAG